MLLYKKIQKFQEGGLLLNQQDSVYIMSKINKDPRFGDKFKYRVEEGRKGDKLYRITPSGKEVEIDFISMKPIDRAVIKYKIDQDLIKEGKEPKYKISFLKPE